MLFAGGARKMGLRHSSARRMTMKRKRSWSATSARPLYCAGFPSLPRGGEGEGCIRRAFVKG